MERKGTSPTKQREAPLERFGIGTVRVLNWAVDLAVLLLFLTVLLYGVYSVRDDTRVFETGDTKVFETYKPTKEDTLSFGELQAINPDVYGWLQVYGTPIDYPVVQGKNLHQYLNLDAAGKFTLSGSLFLDPDNARSMTDPVSIIYGHHMDKGLMFGSLEKFADPTFFEEHPYGDLFFDGQNHGLEFFAYLIADAYDTTVYNTGVSPEEFESYLEVLRGKAQHTRSLDLRAGDRVVLLSTCASGTSNSRYILAARLTDQTFENTFAEVESTDTLPTKVRHFLKELPPWWWAALFIALLLLVGLILYRNKRTGGKTQK
ncbi:MAG: class B sortase [Clostridia bacterium]|nr:class B sortase [Clostridia bacterium]